MDCLFGSLFICTLMEELFLIWGSTFCARRSVPPLLRFHDVGIDSPLLFAPLIGLSLFLLLMFLLYLFRIVLSIYFSFFSLFFFNSIIAFLFFNFCQYFPFIICIHCKKSVVPYPIASFALRRFQKSNCNHTKKTQNTQRGCFVFSSCHSYLITVFLQKYHKWL